MDVLSHGLWGLGLFGFRRHKFIAFLCGIFPDVLPFGYAFIYRLINGSLRMGKPNLASIPKWTFVTYDVTHSLIVAFAVLAAVYYFFGKKAGFAFWAWPFHIMLDIPFHTKEFFPTKMLWPLSDFCIDGVSWTEPIVWFPNFAGIFLVFMFRVYQKIVYKKNKAR